MFRNRIRLPFYLSKPQFPSERNAFRDAAGNTRILSAVIRNTYQGTTDQLPEDWHRKLVVALNHKDVTIEDTRFLSDVVIDGEYEIDWEDFLNKPIAAAKFTIQVTPFNASSNNCQSCAEITQINLVDDYTDDVWDEDTTNVYLDLITGNDEICCFPYTIELVSYNTLYFNSVVIDPDGTLTATVNPVVPTINNVLIATYRVTCENGGYDEANVYGNISGTGIECVPPSNLQVTLTPGDGTEAVLTWDSPDPPPAGDFDWFLYLSSDIYTVIDSGNSVSPVEFHTLIPGESYIFVVQSKCDGSVSVPVQIEFTTTEGGNECGLFSMTFFGTFATADYVLCTGAPEHHEFIGSGSISRCLLLQPGTHTPVLFETFGIVTLTYIMEC